MPTLQKGQNIKLRASPFNPPDSSLAVTANGQTALHPVLHIYRGYALVPTQGRKLAFSSAFRFFAFFLFSGSTPLDAPSTYPHPQSPQSMIT